MSRSAWSIDLKPTQEVADEKFVLPVLREELNVEIRKRVTGIVRLEKTVRQFDSLVDEELVSDSISVEHVPINRYLDEPAVTRQEGDTTVYPVMEEVLIMTKQLVLKEEIRVTRLRQQSRHQEIVPLRTEEIFVERLGRDGLTR
jgi:stress response protein YsnF